MTEERWRRIEQIYEDAFALAEGASRDAYLEQACGTDTELREEVESLLAHSGRAPSIPSIVGGVAAHLSREADEPAGQRVGVYRITGIIGRGGMGVVCRAVRDDAEFQKQVAIKLIKRGMDTALLIARFQSERQILAGLEHPGIARLLDGGATADGRPYFVMEYVDGIPIIDYCERHGLDIEERLRLFRQVCESVQYAHSNLVIHRDIKPENILVTAGGVPKLLDFGLAKVLDAAADSPERTFTMPGAAMFTPDYASPEQVKGQRAGTAADTYSLGAVLYRMLSGVKPHRLKTYTPVEMEQAICVAPLDPPSAVASDRNAARRLRGDLDNIVLKAMQKEPERRYASVREFSQDIQRHLDGWPVEARPDTFAYRARKFLVRNWRSSAVAAFAIVSLAAGIVSTVYQARRAERRFQQTRSLAKAFLFELNDRVRQLPGSMETRKFLVDRGLAYLSALEKEGQGDAELMAELARGYARIGELQGNPLHSNLGNPEAALVNYRKAVEIMERLPLGSSVNMRLSLAEIYVGIGEVHAGRGRMGESVEALRRAHAAIRPVEAASDKRVLHASGHIHNGIARALNREADLPALIEHADKAQQTYRKLVALEPSNQVYLSNLSVALRLLGTAFEKSGRHAEALDQYRQALEIRRDLNQRYPNDPAHKRNLMLAYSLIGDYLRSRGRGDPDYAASLAQLEPMQQIAESLAAGSANDKRAQLDLAESLLRTGAVSIELARFAQAEANLHRAREILTKLMEADARNQIVRRNLVFALERIGHSWNVRNRPVEALRYSKAAVTEAGRILRDAPKSPDSTLRMLSAGGVHVHALSIAGDGNGVAEWSRTIEDLVAGVDPAKVTSRPFWLTATDALIAAAEAHDRLKDHSRACALMAMAGDRWNRLRGPQDPPLAAIAKNYRACPSAMARQ